MTVWPVEVVYEVQRTVYVDAPTEAGARERALDPTRWVDSEQPEERMDTLRLADDDSNGNGNGDAERRHA